MNALKEESCVRALQDICSEHFKEDEYSLDGPKECAVCLEKVSNEWSVYEKEKISVECLKNMSFFVARNKVNVSLPEIDDALQWISRQIMPVVLPQTMMFEFAEGYIASDDKLRMHLLDFLKQADFNISGVNSEIIKEKIPEYYLNIFLNNDRISESEKKRIMKAIT